jgi:[acyl-carrier-protein] S-malonyltransferase
MVQAGVSRLVECGPGRVLGGLVKRIDKSVETVSAGTLGGLHEALGREQ